MITSNLRLVKKVWDNTTNKIDVATRAARDEMMSSLIELSKKQIEGEREYSYPGGKKTGKKKERIYTTAWQGHPTPPMNRTGNLRNSIRGEKFRTGFASYEAIVGPTAVYGRKVELGGPRWKPGVRFPYMEPAYRIYRTQVHQQIINKYFRRFR